MAVRKTPIPTFHPHTYIGFGGTLNSGVSYPEIWTCGIRALDVAAGALPIADCQAYADEIQTKLATWFGYTSGGGGQQGFPSTCKLEWLKVNNILPNGKYADPVTHGHNYAPTIAGKVVAGGAAFQPDIISLAVSWTTDYKRDKAGKGRIYLPNYHVPPTAPGGMTAYAGHPSYWVQTGQLLLDVIRNSTGTHQATPIIAATTGQFHTITGVRVGSTFDVQRRRKSAVPETYVSGPWPT